MVWARAIPSLARHRMVAEPPGWSETPYSGEVGLAPARNKRPSWALVGAPDWVTTRAESEVDPETDWKV